uniref:Helicase ATP-binding domain-containing protein n=1 Tax=viral metagenome TaxID=1070528 RepID=A0A6C0H7J7_9ZZZZ
MTSQIKRYIKDYSYPKYDDDDFISKLYKKREFYYFKVEERPVLTEYTDIQNYRNKNCTPNKNPTNPQLILPNFMSSNTPYKGLLLMHGVGTGKTMTAIRIAEQFKDQIKKYNSKFIVLVPGPKTKKNFEKELLDLPENTYLDKNLLKNMSKEEILKKKRNSLHNALQFYNIMSYKTFHRKVLGEKILKKQVINNTKIKKTYQKTDDGKYERENVSNKITHLNNSIIIVDEAHNISGNEYGDALMLLLKQSINLRVILLTATPMINYADEIINLLNFIRPLNDPIERDKIFTSQKNYMMSLKPNGLEYLQSKAKGFVSFYRGSIPYTFANRNDIGIIPDGLLFTPVIKCLMNSFQNEIYLELITKNEELQDMTKLDDTYSTSFTSGIILLGNFVFPILNKDKTDLTGIYTNEGIETLISQIDNNGDILRKMINSKIFNNKFNSIEESRLIITRNKSITGLILKHENIKHFSSKYYAILENINELVENKKGSCTAFIYSNYVNGGGIELLSETLIQNGYLEYQNNYNNYDIKEDTRDYKTGLFYSEYKKIYPVTTFMPSTFLLLTGGIDESHEEISEVKEKYIYEIFNNSNNINGKYIKFLLGSRVLNEGITLKNVKQVHILEPFFNISKIEQVIGRAVRMCVHTDVINDNYKFPEVDILRYVISTNDINKLSSDEILYKKAELKYLLIKDVERSLKEVAIDCPLLLHANMFPEELIKYKDCIPLTLANVEKYDSKVTNFCPAICDFKKCDIKCDAPDLNANNSIIENSIIKYQKIDKKNIDYTTFNESFAKSEIFNIKSYIKNLFKIKSVYLYDEIEDYIKKIYSKIREETIEDIFIGLALYDLMPITENDLNNFKDIIYDKYNRIGYIIKRDIYYIFQPVNEKHNLPLNYRNTYNIEFTNPIYLNNYIKKKYPNIIDNIKNTNIKSDILNTNINNSYDFNSTNYYYNNREENFIVGIIDKNYTNNITQESDIFKIRPKLINKDSLDKKRGLGISTKGTVCHTYENKSHLINILKKIDQNINLKNISKEYKLNKHNVCNLIKNKLLLLEKYGTSKQENKKTYMIIPFNHPIYIFPYNLEDRILYVINNINNILGYKIIYSVEKINLTNENYHFKIIIKNDNNMNLVNEFLQKYKFVFNEQTDEYISIFD